MNTTNAGAETSPQQDSPPSPSPARPRRRSLRWLEHAVATAAIAGILAVALPFQDWIESAMDCQDELNSAEYIICLGGNPARVIESVRLLQAGYADRLVVTNNAEASIRMRDLAIDFGAPPERILIDDRSHRTLDHPASIRRAVGLDPRKDTCIIVTSYTHLPRAKACFERAGYKRIIMREPRWEREFRLAGRRSWRSRFLAMPYFIYEGAAWMEYWIRGAV